MHSPFLTSKRAVTQMYPYQSFNYVLTTRNVHTTFIGFEYTVSVYENDVKSYLFKSLRKARTCVMHRPLLRRL